MIFFRALASSHVVFVALELATAAFYVTVASIGCTRNAVDSSI